MDAGSTAGVAAVPPPPAQPQPIRRCYKVRGSKQELMTRGRRSSLSSERNSTHKRLERGVLCNTLPPGFFFFLLLLRRPEENSASAVAAQERLKVRSSFRRFL